METQQHAKSKIRSFIDEEWISVKTSLPTRHFIYEVSNYGRIKSINPSTGVENIILGSKGRKGFIKLNLKLKEGKREGYYIHHLVAKHWIKRESEKHKFIIHLDNVKANNHYTNLKWVTREGLNAWMHEAGVFENREMKLGSHVKLNEVKVALLKKRILEGKTKRRILANQLNISYTQLKRIESGVNWGHVEPAV